MTLKITAIGNLTRDAELRTVQSGQVLNFSIARNDRRTKEVTYIDCSIWGKLGESLAQYMRRGQQVFVDGELGLRSYSGNDGQTRTTLTCRVRDCELVGSAGQTGQTGPTVQDQQGQQAQQAQQAREIDDEIPF